MGGIFAVLIIVGGFIFGMGVLWFFGAFGNKPACEPKKAKSIAQKIFAEQQLARQINEELDALPRSANFPVIGTRAQIRREVKKLGVTL